MLLGHTLYVSDHEDLFRCQRLQSRAEKLSGPEGASRDPSGIERGHQMSTLSASERVFHLRRNALFLDT